MKVLSAKVVDGLLDLQPGSLQEGDSVTVLVRGSNETFEVTPAEKEELLAAIAEVERGEARDGWALLDELKV